LLTKNEGSLRRFTNLEKLRKIPIILKPNRSIYAVLKTTEILSMDI